MVTVISTTQLTPAEIQLLSECKASSQCYSISEQIKKAQDRLADLQSRKDAADAALQLVMKTILTSRTPTVDIPDGSSIVRQLTDNVVNLEVQTT